MRMLLIVLTVSAAIIANGMWWLEWFSEDQQLLQPNVVLAPATKENPAETAREVVVAAADSRRSGADFVADGRDDREEIQKALDRLGSHGGTVVLRSGNYHLGTNGVGNRF